MSHAIDSCPPFIIRLNDDPGRGGGIGLTEHRFLDLGVLIPPFNRRIVVRRQFLAF